MIADGASEDAQVLLQQSLRQCRASDAADDEIRVLLSFADALLAGGHHGGAKDIAQQALELSIRGGYRLFSAAAYYCLCRIAHYEHDTTAVHEHAGAAEREALCDGPPHCYQDILEKARQSKESAV
jgi:hypothetical protein